MEVNKKAILLVIISFILSSCTSIRYNIHTWNWTNTALETSCVALSIIDAIQTGNNARDNWSGYRESNTLLGSYPHQDKVYGFIAGGVLVHIILAIIMPEKVRYAWQGGCIAAEGYTVIKNENTRRNNAK